MIEITEIQDPIVEDIWRIKGADGNVTSHRILVGHPCKETEDKDSDWYCPVLIEGFTDRIVPAMGVGSVDSLMNAMVLVKSFFDQHKENIIGIGISK